MLRTVTNMQSVYLLTLKSTIYSHKHYYVTFLLNNEKQTITCLLLMMFFYISEFLTTSCNDLYVGLKVEKRGPRHRVARHDVESNSESQHTFRKPKRVDRCSISESMLGSKGSSP